MPHATGPSLQLVSEQTRLFQRDYGRFTTYMARISPRIPCADLLLSPHYVEVKLNDVRRHLRSLYDRCISLRASLARNPVHTRLESELETVEATLADKEKELVVLARQTRAVQQDLADELRATPRVDDAYLAVLAHKMMVSTRNARARSQSLGRSAVTCAYYGTLAADGQAHCALWGKIPFAQVTPASIVPPALQGPGLAHLLGVKVLDLYEPRNVLPLEGKAAQALVDGQIVFVPTGPFGQDKLAWKLVLVDKEPQYESAGFGRRWKVSRFSQSLVVLVDAHMRRTSTGLSSSSQRSAGPQIDISSSASSWRTSTAAAPAVPSG